MKIKNLILAVSAIAITSAVQAVTVTKSPDLGAHWHPLSPDGGTYVYANSFVATETGTVTGLGTWMEAISEDAATEVIYHVLGSLGGIVANGPSMSSILATSNAVSGISGSLSYYGAGMQSSSVLTAGETYWFAASVVDSVGYGRYQFGAHTQNSEGIVDNGTFWFSNSSDGSYFDGQNYTPEMAFSVEINGASVPDTGASFALLGLGLGALAFVRRKMA